MLGLGWTEMLVIGVVALIVIGPRDLPVVMNRIGKFAGQIRRMGADFQREINKTTGLDEVRNLRNSITAPLKQTTDEIRKEFNMMTATGPKPSGVIKPADPKAESVVDEIKAKAGMNAPKTADEVAAEAGFKPAGPAPKAPKATAPTPAASKPVKAKAAPTRPVITTELAPIEAEATPAKKAPAARKVPAKKAEAAPEAAPAETPAPKKRAPAKPKAPSKTAAKAESE